MQAGPARRSVTVGSIRFLIDDATTATCDLETDVCARHHRRWRASATSQLAADFYARSAATRLRRDASGRTGDTVASTVDVAGQTATCVAIPLAASTETYCALDSGPLARIDAADVRIELTSYSDVVDEAKFARRRLSRPPVSSRPDRADVKDTRPIRRRPTPARGRTR